MINTEILPAQDEMRATAEKEGWLTLHNALQAIINQAKDGKFQSQGEYIAAIEQILTTYRSTSGAED